MEEEYYTPIPTIDEIRAKIDKTNEMYLRVARTRPLRDSEKRSWKNSLQRFQSEIDTWLIQPGDLVRYEGKLRILDRKTESKGSGNVLYWTLQFGNGENCWHASTVNLYPTGPDSCINMEWPVAKPQSLEEYREYKKSLIRWWDQKPITRDQFRKKKE